ncbi:MAG: preprotein translocase subunit YajC [Phycisphaerae bacterium]|nr:preprotein translocase subunit YajC [Phycisphaerae bacterium]
MNAKTIVVLGLILILPVCTATLTYAQDAQAPAVKPAGDGGFEADGQPAGDAAAEPQPPAEDKTPADKKTEEEAPPKESPSMFGQYFPFILIGAFLIMMMFMSRGRKKKEAERRAMLDNLSKGDRVVTIGGIVGTIVETRETEIVVKVDDNTRMKFARWAVRNAGDAANEDKKKDTQEQQ